MAQGCRGDDLSIWRRRRRLRAQLYCDCALYNNLWTTVFSGVLDRNVQVGFMLVDDLYRKHPKMMQDQFWNEMEPEIPYTEAAKDFKTDPYLGSTFSMKSGRNN